jgi:aminotransferase
MDNFIKKNLHEISISGIRQFNQKANKIEGVIKLTLGELDFDTPDNIKEAVSAALANNYTRSTENAGLLELRKNISFHYKNYGPNDIIMTVGTTEGLATVIKSTIEVDDEVIIPTPGYVGYKPLVLLEGGVVKELNVLESDFHITKQALEALYTDKTKMIIITNPNNPTGKILNLDEMETIKDFVLEKNILLVADEIYSEIDFEDKFKSFTEYSELRENLVCLNGFSKSHAMTGFRIGYILSDDLLIKHLLKTHQYSVTSATSISQYAALEATNTDASHIAQTLKKRRDYLLERLDKMGLPYIKPEGAFYVFVDISKYSKSSIAFCEKLLYTKRVACIPGESFLGDNRKYIRLSYAIKMEDLE